MGDGEIEIPKSVRPIMMDEAKETRLGERRGAKKQYRYGKLHIREYDDKYIVHMDRVDPRVDPLGHLLKDSPETLLGIASGIYFGGKTLTNTFNKINGSSKHPLLESLLMGALASITAGYLSYNFGRKLKRLR